MKSTAKRLLALILAVVLLIGCTISGVVLSAKAEETTKTTVKNLITNGNIDGDDWKNVTVADEGVDGSRALRVGASAVAPAVNFALSEPLSSNKTYIFRFKVRGGTAQVWSQTGSYGTHKILEKQTSETDWTTAQFIFTPHTAHVDTLTIPAKHFYFYNQRADKSTNPNSFVYYDDFEIVEYVHGMNVFPASDGETLPYLGSTSGINAFEYFLNGKTASTGNGDVTFSVAKDGQNSAWLFSGVAGGYHLSLGMLTKVLTKDEEAILSFRYKSAGDTAATVTVATGDSNRSTVTMESTTTDGWTHVKATVKLLKNDNYVYLVKLVFSGSKEVLIDDFYVGKKVTVQLTEEAVTMEEGTTTTLNATAIPADVKIWWSSSDESVATVDSEGKVTAIKPGEVTITAAPQYGEGDTCEVMVTEKPTIDIEQQSVSVVAGEFAALSFVATPPNAKITWSSSDEGIATVENGVVTGVRVGTATITAQITETVKDTCEVVVTPVSAGANLIVGGDFEGDYWNGKKNIISGQGFGDQGNAFCVTQAAATANLPANLRLSQSLEAGKWYMLRFKTKGGFAQMYVSDSSTTNAAFSFMTYYTSIKDSATDPVRTNTHANYLHEGNWVQHYKIFQATEAMASLEEWGTKGVLFYSDRNVGADLYYDDFELVEYVPGMNITPGADGTLLPYATNSAQSHFFYPWLRAGVQISLAEDGNAWQLSNLGEGLTSTPYLNCLANGVFPANSELTISFRYKGEGASVYAQSASAKNAVVTYSNTTEQEDGWKFYEVRFTLLKRGELNSALSFVFSGADTMLIDDFYFAENTKLSVSDLTWTPDVTQATTNTPMSFSVKLKNQGVRPVSEGSDILVKLYARDGEREVLIDTLVHKGGLEAGEEVTLATKTPWSAVAGEWVIAAQTNISVLGRVEKAGTQGNLRVAETLLTAPTQALAGGFDTLTFSDDFDTANVDTAYTGDYGYKWYLTDVTGVSADADDFRLTGNSTMILEENGEIRYNWTMATIDANTGAGWAGFKHGYLEFRIRFSRDALPGYDNVKNAPAVWSFPPEKIAPRAYGTLELGVEMDWMEYWSDYWTITMHEQNRQNTQWIHNQNSYAIRDSKNDIGDNEWHTLGYRWEKGLLIAYLDGREIFYQSWSENGGNPAFTLAKGELKADAMMQLDNQTLVLILAGTAGKPLEIDYIRVWQKDEQNPYKFPVDNAKTTLTELHWAPGVSAGVPLSGDKSICYTSSDNKVASVDDNGIVYTHTDGKATITAYKDGKALGQYALTVDRYGERIPCCSFEMPGDIDNGLWYHDDSKYRLVADGKGYLATETDGNHALAIPAGKYGTLNNLKIEPGKTYRFSGRVKGDAGVTLVLLNDINLYDSNSNGSEKTPVASGKTGQWVDFSYTFTTTKVKDGAFMCSKSYTIYLQNTSGSTTAYFDDLSLVETDGLVMEGIGTRWEVDSVTKNALFNYCFGPSLNVADYTVTFTSGDESILKEERKSFSDIFATKNTYMYTKAFGSAYVTVTAKPSSGTTLTKTVKVSVVGGNLQLFTVPNTTVKFLNNSGAALTSISAGSAIKMKFATESGYLPVAGSLRFTTNGMVRRINNRDSADNTGNTFTFTAPSQKFAVSMQTTSTESTNFSMATSGTSVRYKEGTEEVNGVRFLTRLYVDNVSYNANGRLVLTVDGTEYVVREMGSLLKRVANTAKLNLENARDEQYKNATSGNKKIWQSVCYKPNNNSLYALDSTEKYVDFAVSMLTSSPSDAFNNRRYEVCGYVELERADGSTFTVYSESMIDSVTQAVARVA